MLMNRIILIKVLNIWRIQDTCSVAVRVIIADDGPGAPVEGVIGGTAFEDDPLASLVLSVAASVVHHNVRNATHSDSVELVDRFPQLLLVAILAVVQVVQSAWHITLRCYGMAGRREPHVRDARCCQLFRFGVQDVIPARALP